MVVSLLAGGSTAVYGVFFLLVGAGCGLWVRVADALTAPVAAPIAFAAGLGVVSDGEGFGGWLVELATMLAVNAGWLYGGTALAAVIAVVRRSMMAAQRRRLVREAARPRVRG
ncbi:DUF6542 domain-containing protein [Streptomyces alkaliterrae]|uniref:DUF6542 domain-containing protein n=2 Tax=Streptomyces alkaliterrae TaxID=2213162 RepID=A0A7W3X0K3_9ACTN|nr:DUF6542 domain-containing protein [Streptomyces alkaliterrae]MBB1261923.1 hypothetical protein [Streptomyces alkaliterrae]